MDIDFVLNRELLLHNSTTCVVRHLRKLLTSILRNSEMGRTNRLYRVVALDLNNNSFQFLLISFHYLNVCV